MSGERTRLSEIRGYLASFEDLADTYELDVIRDLLVVVDAVLGPDGTPALRASALRERAAIFPESATIDLAEADAWDALAVTYSR